MLLYSKELSGKIRIQLSTGLYQAKIQI